MGLQPGDKVAARLVSFYKKWSIPNAERLLDEFHLAT
jgi:hypothetical protein